MTQAFKRFGPTLALALAVLFLMEEPVQAFPRTWYGGYYSPGSYGSYGYYPYSSWYGSNSYFSGGYSYYPSASYSYPYYSYPYYGYGLGYPIGGYYASGYSPTYGSVSYTPPAPTTSFYQDSSSPITSAVYSETAFGSDRSTLSDRTAHLKVRVSDPNADVVINGIKTNSIGMVREYRSPALEDGNYTYEIRATWTENGQTKTKTQKIKVSPGTWSVVNFPDSPAN